MNQIPSKIIYIVVAAISVLAFCGVASLCASLFLHTYADPAVLTAIITLTGGLVGSLGTLLASPRTQPQGTTVTSTTSSPVETSTPVTVTNSPSEPVPVKPQPEGQP